MRARRRLGLDTGPPPWAPHAERPPADEWPGWPGPCIRIANVETSPENLAALLGLDQQPPPDPGGQRAWLGQRGLIYPEPPSVSCSHADCTPEHPCPACAILARQEPADLTGYPPGERDE
jgi:hypothetical protein